MLIKPLKKILKKYKKVEDSLAEMSQEEFLQWIDNAEKSHSMSLETFNEKWEKEKQQIQSLISFK